MAFNGGAAQHNGLTPREVLMSGDYNGNSVPVAVTSGGLLQTTPGSGSVQNVAVANLTTITTAQVTATTTSGATQYVPALPGRKDLIMKNASTTQGVFVGPTGVTASNGHYLGPGESLSFSGLDGAAALAYFVITASSTALCTYLGVS